MEESTVYEQPEEKVEVAEVKKPAIPKKKIGAKSNSDLKAELKEMKAKLKEMQEITDHYQSTKQTVDVGNGKETAEICFFTEIDYDSKGNLRAVYPFYHNLKVMEDARDNLRRMERSVDRGDIPKDYLPQTMNMIKETKVMIDTYESHLPSIKKNIDGVKRTRDILADVIAPTLFTRREMSLGLVDPHEEARRMAEPCIDVPQDLRAIAAKNGVMMDNRNRASRNDISRLYQMCQRELGEPADVEYLRKD
jgi:hypothetical protein